MKIFIKTLLSHTPTFFMKCLIITFFIGFLFSCCYPKYDFIDAKHRCNKITGKSEYYFNPPGCYPGWRE